MTETKDKINIIRAKYTASAVKKRSIRQKD